jgi:hypothetical protein
MKYNLAINENMSIRKGHGVAYEKRATLTSATNAGGDELWSCTVDGELLNAKAGDLWIHLTLPIDGWVAVVHAGVRYGNVTDVTAPPADVTLKHTIEVYSNGSLVIDGIAYP